jgi:hypothetical protein
VNKKVVYGNLNDDVPSHACYYIRRCLPFSNRGNTFSAVIRGRYYFILSYSTPIAVIDLYTKDYVITTIKYSQTTTKQVNYVKGILLTCDEYGKPRFLSERNAMSEEMYKDVLKTVDYYFSKIFYNEFYNEF